MSKEGIVKEIKEKVGAMDAKDMPNGYKKYVMEDVDTLDLDGLKEMR